MAVNTSHNQQSSLEESPTFGKSQAGGILYGEDSKYGILGGESPANPPGAKRVYLGGGIISPSLPDHYQDGRGLEKQCGNCYFNKKGYCNNFNAGIREEYTCGSWGEQSLNENLIILEKQAYGSKRVTDQVETEFAELTQNNKKDLSTFFNLYNTLFFDIPKDGSESHEDLVKRSRDYLNNYIDPKDSTIEALRDEIEHLNGTLLNNSMKGAAVSNNLTQFSSIDKITIPKISLREPDGSHDLDPEDRDNWPTIGDKVTPTPIGSDENNDGIEDSKQTLSKYGTVMLWCQESGTVTNVLSNPNHWYYKPKYYGKPWYCFLRKLPLYGGSSGVTNLIVVNLGSKGDSKHRYLKYVGSQGTEFRIQKKYWTDSNSWPSGKDTGAAGYLLEPI